MSHNNRKEDVDNWWECELFDEFHTACLSSNPKTALNSLTAWLGHCCQDRQNISMKRFLQNMGNQRFAEQMGAVREAVESQKDWSGQELYLAVVEALQEARAKRSFNR